MPALSPLLTVMTKAVDKAARGLKRDFGEVEHLQVSTKGPGDFVSVADKKAEKTIYEELSKARPNFSFLMEEGGSVKASGQEIGRFIIDPLDGTTNFLHGLPHWAISIAAEEKGEIIAGVVYDPIKDEMFWAEKGRGAFVNNHRLRVSGRKDMAAAAFATGNVPAYKDTHKLWFKQIETVFPVTGALRRFGSAALDMAYVAAGRLDGYWENIVHPWDVAAGLIILSEAGGKVSRVDGNRYELGSHDILATNGTLHEPMVGLLKKAL
jgi:myo-inositol-1(or 4)-monophosphatase